MSYSAVVVIEADEMTYDVKGPGHADVLVIDLRSVDMRNAAERCAEWGDAVASLSPGDPVRRYVEDDVIDDVRSKYMLTHADIDAESD
jgi:hypothetical protein